MQSHKIIVSDLIRPDPILLKIPKDLKESLGIFNYYHLIIFIIYFMKITMFNRGKIHRIKLFILNLYKNNDFKWHYYM